MNNMATTISLEVETKEALRRLGEKGESYDAILRRLLQEVQWHHLDDRWNDILRQDEFIPLDAL